jgi:hypothetical protein
MPVVMNHRIDIINLTTTLASPAIFGAVFKRAILNLRTLPMPQGVLFLTKRTFLSSPLFF